MSYIGYCPYCYEPQFNINQHKSGCKNLELSYDEIETIKINRRRLEINRFNTEVDFLSKDSSYFNVTYLFPDVLWLDKYLRSKKCVELIEVLYVLDIPYMKTINNETWLHVNITLALAKDLSPWYYSDLVEYITNQKKTYDVTRLLSEIKILKKEVEFLRSENIAKDINIETLRSNKTQVIVSPVVKQKRLKKELTDLDLVKKDRKKYIDQLSKLINEEKYLIASNQSTYKVSEDKNQLIDKIESWKNSMEKKGYFFLGDDILWFDPLSTPPSIDTLYQKKPGY
jgi:hypothetical protein